MVDAPFLCEMLYEAAVPPDTLRPSLEEVLGERRNARFVDNWGRPGDLGVVAEEGGQFVGAAWLRLHTGEEIAPGYSGDAVAQLAIGLVPSARGMGWGRKLLDRLLDEARSLGLGQVQLTVGLANVAAVRLYQRVGFSILASDGRSARMICRLNSRSGPEG
ncbi:MAG: GNAT family N-acetyltransferase [Actinomycetota bacterium]|nr:GNAT family N-acetyltransferase [Actinomycetota bacterium]